MNTDCGFYIGTTHKICQDYALAGKKSIAISDGCSGSDKTDIGSRVLCITALNKMKEIDSLYNFEEKECILLARPSIKMLNIPIECLDATLLLATEYDDKTIQAACLGDGVIVIKTKKEDFIINCAYTDSYPFYMNYLYDKTGRYQNWIQNHNKREITISTIKINGEIETTVKKPDSLIRIKDIGILRIIENKIIIEIIETNLIEYIAIMSDGVHSFYETISTETSKCNKSISYLEVLKELLSFKNYNQAFVQRRINKFRKDCIKKNWSNADDVSLAVIYNGE